MGSIDGLAAASTLRGSIHYLSRLPLYATEKPYTIRYTLPSNSPIPRTNAVHEEFLTPVTDIRGRESEFSIAQHGFCVTNHDSGMSYDDFAVDEKVVRVYLPGVARKLKEALGARHVQVYEHTIRRRDAQYPVSTGKEYHFDQPTNTAHIDVTETYVRQLVQRINNSLPQDMAKGMSRHEVQCINVWKPLRGPLRDWPLCVCDATTVDAERDLVPSDQVFPKHVVENIQVHHSPAQKWYYLSEQKEDELWIFQQTASQSQGRHSIGNPHCSFFNENICQDSILRESIECRALVYFGECEGACAR